MKFCGASQLLPSNAANDDPSTMKLKNCLLHREMENESSETTEKKNKICLNRSSISISLSSSPLHFFNPKIKVISKSLDSSVDDMCEDTLNKWQAGTGRYTTAPYKELSFLLCLSIMSHSYCSIIFLERNSTHA